MSQWRNNQGLISWPADKCLVALLQCLRRTKPLGFFYVILPVLLLRELFDIDELINIQDTPANADLPCFHISRFVVLFINKLVEIEEKL